MKRLKVEAVENLRDFDCWYDARTCRNIKRRRLNFDDDSKKLESVKMAPGIEDQDYLTFLELLRGEGDEGIDADSEEEDDIDPDYKIFLENLRKDGKSYVLEMKKEDGTTVFVKYEEEDFPSVEIKKEDINISSEERKDSEVTEDLSLEPLNIGFGRPFLLDCKQTASPVDESYYLFLSRIRVDGHFLILECEDGIMKYEEDNEISTDSEGLAKKGNPYSGRKFTPYETPKLYDSSTDEDEPVYVQSEGCVNGSSEYEEKLKKTLRMPFNKKEFEELLEAAKTHKQLERLRNLRGRAVSYPTDQTCSSYLDYYPDLAAMIEKAISRRQHDRYKALSLLRCLFFYLKNLSHEGAFMPWKNLSILKMIQAHTRMRR